MPTPEPQVVVAFNFTLTITNVDSDAETFNTNYLMQNVVKDALQLTLYTIKRSDVKSVTAEDGWSATVLVLFIQITALLNGSGYTKSQDLFAAATSEFFKAVQDGSLARNLQKAANNINVPALSVTAIDKGNYQSPVTYSVNGVMTASAAKATQSTQSADDMPLPLVLAAVIGGLVVFAVMYQYSRMRAATYLAPEDDPLMGPNGDGRSPDTPSPDDTSGGPAATSAPASGLAAAGAGAGARGLTPREGAEREAR